MEMKKMWQPHRKWGSWRSAGNGEIEFGVSEEYG
jgi:hypothetical protein